MSAYNPPILHNGVLNSIINVSDMTTTNNTSSLNVSTADARYLKLTGGTLSGSLNLPNEVITTETAQNQIVTGMITTPTITLSSGTVSQTSSMLGYYKTVNLAITGGSISNGTPSSPSYNLINLTAGVWIVYYYHTITCTDTLTLTQITHGLTTSSSGVHSAQLTQSSFLSETINTGNTKYITNSYILRLSATTNIYSPITISYTTSGTITINFGFNAFCLAQQTTYQKHG